MTNGIPRRAFLACWVAGAAAMGASVPAGARRYRVDAVVQAWGLTVFARQGVGEAWAELQGE
ncbi:hypothetical protein WDZ92_46795, partial [Nostoc sp. NIES-2111]